MVTRRRFRTVLNVLALYAIAALLIAYFGVNAFSGNHGLRAKQDLERQIAQLSRSSLRCGPNVNFGSGD